MLNSIIDDMVQSEATATAVTLSMGQSIFSCRGGATVAGNLRCSLVGLLQPFLCLPWHAVSSLSFVRACEVMKQLAVQRQFRLALRPSLAGRHQPCQYSCAVLTCTQSLFSCRGVYDRLVEDGLETTAITCSCLVRFAAEAFDTGLDH